MQRRPQGDSPEEQLLKANAHKKARDTLKHYEDQQNYLGAYVILFALFEDRIRAIAVLFYRDVKKVDYGEKLSFSLTKVINGLKGTVLTDEIYKPAFEIALKRNRLIHDAIYNLHAFTKEHIDELRTMEAKLDSIRRKLTRQITAQKASNPK